MSIQTNVFLPPHALPEAGRIRSALAASAFPVELDGDPAPSPAITTLTLRYAGQPVRLAWRCEHLDPAALLAEGLIDGEALEQLDGRLLRVSLYSDSWRALMGAMVLAAVVTELGDGLLAEGGCAPFIPATRALEWARACRRTVEAHFPDDPAP